ncbi:MAG TPA: FUSC family protein [Friedmanniella sp.]
MSPLTWLRQHDPGLRALRRAARVAIVMPLLFAFGSQVVHDVNVATFAAFGSFALLLLVDLNGSRAERVQGVAWLAVVGALLVALATVVSRQPALAAVTMAVVGFVVLFSGVVSSELAGASTALLLAFVLPVATPAPLAAIPYRMAGWLLAAAVAAFAVGFWWPAPPRSPLRGPSARTCRLFAERLVADHRVAVGDLTPAERDEITDRLTAAYEALRSAFYATPNRPTDLGTSSRVLVRLVDELGWLLTVDQQSPPVAPGHPVDSRILAVKSAAARALQAAADELDVMSRGSVRAERGSGESRLRAALDELRTAVAALETSAEDLPLGGTGGPGGAPGGGRDLDAGLVDALEPTFRAQETAFAVMEVVRNVERALEAERRPWLRRLLGRDPGGTGGALTTAVERARTHLDPHSVWLHNSLRGGVALGAAVLVADLSGLQHSFWVVLGTLSVLRSNALSTGQTVLRGILGTVVGIVVGGVLVTLVGTNVAVLWTLLPISILVAGLAPAAVSFAAGQAAFTLTLTIFFNIIQPVGYRIGIARIEDIAIGCAVSLVFGLLFWPRGAAAALGRALAEAYGSTGAYLARAVRFGVDRCERGGLSLPRPVLEATQAAAASRRLDDAFREYLAERGRKQSDLATVTALVTGVVAPRLVADAVLALWEREDGSRDGDRSAAGHELGRDADLVAGWYTELGQALASSSAPPAPADRDAAGDARLVDAVRRDLDDGSGMASPTAVRMIWTGDHLDALRRLQPALLGPASTLADVG